MKRVLTIVITIILCGNIYPCFVSAKSENEIIYVYDNFDERSIYPLMYINNGSAVKKSIDAEHGMSIERQSVGMTGGIGYYTSDILSEGVYQLSYSLYCKEVNTNTIVRFLSANAEEFKQNTDSIQALSVSDGGVVKYYGNPSPSNWMLNRENSAQLKLNDWNSIIITLNTFTDEIRFYVNNELLGMVPFYESLGGGIKGFIISTDKKSGGAPLYFDNIKFCRLKETDYSDGDRLGISAKTDVIGNNFFMPEQKPEFKITFKNAETSRKDIKAVYNITDEKGEQLYHEEREFSTDALSETEQRLNPDVNRYGIFNLNIYADGVSYDTRFAVLNRSKNMPMNNMMGVCLHIDKGRGDQQTVLEMMHRAGIGVFRGEDLRISAVEKSLGVFALNEQQQLLLDTCDAYGIDYLNLAVGTSNYFDYDAAKTEAGLSNLEEYAYNIVKLAKGKIKYIEVCNEPHSNKVGWTAEDVANFYRAVYRGVKRADSEVSVVAIDEDRWGMYDTGFAEKILAALNGERCFDMVSLHPYPRNYTSDPEYGEIDTFVYDMTALLEKYGYKDVPILFTELGWNTYANTEFQSAINTVRAQAFVRANNLAEKVFIYNMLDYNFTGAEGSFGLLEAYDSGMVDVPYLAKPGMLAVANYNRLLADAEYIDKYDESDANTYMYHFRQNASGEDVLMLGTMKGDKDIGLKLGCDSVTVSDLYGNEKILYGENGVFSINLTESTVYLTGRFEGIKITNPVFEIENTSISIPVESIKKIRVIKHTADEFQAESFCISDLKTECTEFEGEYADVSLYTGKELSNGVVCVTIKNNGKLYYEGWINYEVVTSGIASDFRIEAYNDDMRRWEISFDLTNIRDDKSIGGTIKVKKADGELGTEDSIPNLTPGETRRVYHYFPRGTNLGEIDSFDAEIRLDSGETIVLSERMELIVASYTRTPPDIDGIISDNEWGSDLIMLNISGEDKVVNITDYKGDKDLSGRAWLNYDEENLYFAAEVTDNIFCQNEKTNEMWKGDSIQIGVAIKGTSSNTTTLCFGLTGGKAEAYMHLKEEDQFGAGDYEAGEVAVVNNGNKTCYEIKIPWESICPAGNTVKRGDKIYFSMIINDNDGSGRRGWLKYGEGVSGNNIPSVYKRLLLLDNKQN